MGGFIIFLLGVVVLAAIVGWFRAREDEDSELTPGLGESFAHLLSFTGGRSVDRHRANGVAGPTIETGASADS